MEILLSGYGKRPDNTVALYHYDGDDSISLKWQTSIDQASFLCEGDGYLFTITEEDDHAYVYLLKRIEEGYHLLDQRKINGGALCHITYSSENKALFGACYGTGTVFSIRVEQGKFGELLHHEIQEGEKIDAITRAHYVLLNKEETLLAAINIALDQVYFYNLNNGIMTPSGVLQVPKNTGPRHALYSQDETLLYIITEYSNEILVYDLDSKELIHRYTTLAKDFTGSSNCSTLCFSKDGRYLYAANRGADSIVLFAVHQDGSLTLLGEFDCGGKHPRHMIISPDGSHLMVCNQHSDNIAIFKLNQKNGHIDQLLSMNFPTPSGVLAFE